MSTLTRDETVEPVSRDQILRREREQRNIHFPCSADHEQEWQHYPVDPYSAISDGHTHIPLLLSFPIPVGFCRRAVWRYNSFYTSIVAFERRRCKCTIKRLHLGWRQNYTNASLQLERCGKIRVAWLSSETRYLHGSRNTVRYKSYGSA